MNSAAILLLSNQFWYGFFIGTMIVLMAGILFVAILGLRKRLTR